MTQNSTKLKTDNPLLRPIVTLIQSETFSGILLISVTVVALILANSGLQKLYSDFWKIPIQIGIGDAVLSKPLYYWINDGLMAIFFFVIGLEIKRELLVGELSDLRQATLPIVAAAGGILTPAIIYALVTAGSGYEGGWGVPVATDIAFSLGVLALLGKRVPLTLKIFLTALAIVDDLGAVLAIAIFYTSEISFMYLGIAFATFAIMILLNIFGFRNVIVYSIISVFALWLPFLLSGVHATIAGVLAAFVIPLNRKIRVTEFGEELTQHIKIFQDLPRSHAPGRILTGNQQQVVKKMKDLCEKAESPVQRLEDHFHPIAIFFVMPIFALANTGVEFSFQMLGDIWRHPVGLGIIGGLVLGKFLGITIFSWIACKLKIASLPEDVKWGHIMGIGAIAGIGFTMSLFISDLAFQGEELTAISKIAIFIASGIAGIFGYTILRITLPSTTNK